LRRSGFTLIEMMAVVVLTAILLAAATDFYIDLSTASRAAIERVRGDRRAVAVVDRVAQDLQGAVLVKKPEELDPLEHPWLFLAQGEGEYGAEQLKFDGRGRLPRGSAAHESDLEQIAYWLQAREDGSFDLVRWSQPHLPAGLDRAFPPADDPAAAVLAEGVAAFGVRLVGDAGEWVSAWDSSQIVDSSELPVAAEISVALLPEAEDGTPLEVDPLVEGGPQLVVATRRVLLPLRPMDLEAQKTGKDSSDAGDSADEDDDEDGDDSDDEASAEGDEDANCMTVGQCILANQGVFDSLPPETQATIRTMANLCYRDVAGSLAVPGVVGCE
jgi:prepilin-type N-terminal cleavage/methylation domain-containing protein